MKKLKILSFIFFATILTACQQPNDDAAAAESQNADLTTEQATQQFEQSDAQISQYLDVLDAPRISIKEKTQVLCHDYPHEYKTNYMPAMLKLAAQDYTQDKMLNDLKIAQDYYKVKLKIECPAE
ncbi:MULTISPECIES: hypothetical protein [unclassified Acinetobacter]|uniref:hypothetical protein n=1 Tax=unclassified Acinetobacter TaxID=196816 RepID=UPI0015D22BDE|nr:MULTISPECIES: hypothetical protein [unclassified Acinetobacter]